MFFPFSENPVFGSNIAFLNPTVEEKLSTLIELFITMVFSVYNYGFSNDHKTGLLTVILEVSELTVPDKSKVDELVEVATIPPV